MRPLKLAIASLISLFVLASTAAATTPPKIYKGSVTGTAVETEIGSDVFNPVTTTDTFEVTGLKLKRIAWENRLGGKRATYKVTGGTVHWVQTATGRCTHSTEQTFDLVGNVDKRYDPLVFDLYRSKWTMLGALHTTKIYTVIDTCTFSDGYVMPRDLNVAPGALFSVGGSSVKQSPKRSIERTFRRTTKNSVFSRSQTWKLSIKKG